MDGRYEAAVDQLLASELRVDELRVTAVAAGPLERQGICRQDPSGARSYELHPDVAAVSPALR